MHSTIDAKKNAIENRDLETQDRIIKDNTLGAERVWLESINKNFYDNTNEAKYKDYVLVEGRADAASTPLVV